MKKDEKTMLQHAISGKFGNDVDLSEGLTKPQYMKNTAIIYFCFNRVYSVEKTLPQVLKNITNQKLFIFCDGARNVDEIEKCKQVQDLVFKLTSSIENKQIKVQAMNQGLKRSVIAGVNEAFEEFEKVIVIEDDILISNNFIDFCEESLNRFENNKNIFSITGFNYPNSSKELGIFLNPRFNPWGWAIWKDRWQSIAFEKSRVEEGLKKKKEIKKIFPLLPQFLKHLDSGKIDSWATYVALEAILSKRVTVTPGKSLVQNLGFKEGTHFSGKNAISKIYKNYQFDLCPNYQLNLNQDLEKDFIKNDKKFLATRKNMRKIVWFVIGFACGFLSNFIF